MMRISGGGVPTENDRVDPAHGARVDRAADLRGASVGPIAAADYGVSLGCRGPETRTLRS
jgi:hypothetical protein